MFLSCPQHPHCSWISLLYYTKGTGEKTVPGIKANNLSPYEVKVCGELCLLFHIRFQDAAPQQEKGHAHILATKLLKDLIKYQVVKQTACIKRQPVIV
jgi:hypothetical protein